MEYSHEVQNMCCVAKGPNHGPAPIPEEGKWVQAKEITDRGCHMQKQFLDYLHQGITEEQLELMRLFAERVQENIKNIEEVIWKQIVPK